MDEELNQVTTYPYQTMIGWTNPKTIDERFKFLDASYSGQGGYATGYYLTPHRREDEPSFVLRKSKARIINDFRTIIDGWISPIFRNEPVENLLLKNESYVTALALFLSDCDGNGTPYRVFMKRFARASRKYDSAFVIVEAPEIQSEFTMADLKDRSKLPYLILLTPDKVKEIKMSETGRIESISWITINSKSMVNQGALKVNDPSKQMMITWDLNGWCKTIDGEIVDQSKNGLPQVPAIVLYPESNDNFSLDPIPYGLAYTLATIQHRRYNLASIIDEIADGQAFSILAIPGSPRDITVGVGNALTGLPEVGNMPAYISPDADQMKTLMDLMNQLTEEMYRTGNMPHLRNFAQSAESKRLDNERTSEALGDWQQQVKHADEQIIRIFGMYLGVDFGYTATYNSQLGSESLEDLTTLYVDLSNATIPAPPIVLGELMHKIYKSVDPDGEEGVTDDQIEQEFKSYYKSFEVGGYVNQTQSVVNGNPPQVDFTSKL